jgi:putative tricarboxylic transport membrane protein
MKKTNSVSYALAAAGAMFVGVAAGPASAEWKPTRTVEFIVPAGTGGGADQMARMLQGIVQKHNLSPQSIVVINKSGGAGAEGFLDVKGSARNPHKIIITLSNLFTTPLATGVPFKWDDMTPVAMLALDEFVLWNNAKSPYNTAKEFVDAAKKEKFSIGGTGSKQEDQIIGVAMAKATRANLTYVPFRGGGEVAVQLVGRHIDASVNNPIEAVTHWRSGALRPLCVFDGQRLAGTEKITETASWSDIPTAKESGMDVEYLMLRGIFMPAGVQPAQLAFYEELLGKVRETPEWRELMQQGAFNTTSLTGEAFRAWLTKEEARHRGLMQEAGFVA